MEEVREKFELWVIAQFGKDTACLLSRNGDGDTDTDINNMWIPFFAGSESVSW